MTNIGNHAAHLQDSIRRVLNRTVRGNAMHVAYANFVGGVTRDLARAGCFWVDDARFHGTPEKVHCSLSLPYPETVIEFVESGKKRLLLVKEIDGGRLGIVSASTYPTTAGAEWAVFPATIEIGCGERPQTVLRERLVDAASGLTFWLTWSQFAADDEAAFASLGPDAVTVMRFIFFLASLSPRVATSVETSRPGDALNRKRLASGKAAFFSYHVLEIARTIAATDNGGTHASPKWHTRVSHDRHLADGRVVRVKACDVGDPIRGIAFKDYLVPRLTSDSRFL